MLLLTALTTWYRASVAPLADMPDSMRHPADN
jgi:hypothetical protein